MKARYSWKGRCLFRKKKGATPERRKEQPLKVRRVEERWCELRREEERIRESSSNVWQIVHNRKSFTEYLCGQPGQSRKHSITDVQAIKPPKALHRSQH